jgi:hypothetical protein
MKYLLILKYADGEILEKYLDDVALKQGVQLKFDKEIAKCDLTARVRSVLERPQDLRTDPDRD